MSLILHILKQEAISGCTGTSARELETELRLFQTRKASHRNRTVEKINEVYIVRYAKNNEDNTFAARLNWIRIKPLTEYFNTLGRIDILLDLDLFLKDSYGKLEELRKKNMVWRLLCSASGRT